LAELSIHIKQLNTKLQLLIKQYGMVHAENEQLKKSLSALQESDKAQKENIAALRQEQLILKASIDKMDELEKKELEQKINGYIKNIDKCISLLSHKHNVE
jgi:small-conductance mechanosensitive channel